MCGGLKCFGTLWFLHRSVRSSLLAPDHSRCAKVLSQCEAYELLYGEITTVGTKTLRLRGSIVPTKHPATSSRSRATWNAASTSARIWSSMSCRPAEYVPGGSCDGVSSMGDKGQGGYSTDNIVLTVGAKTLPLRAEPTMEGLPVNLDTWKLFFKQYEGQHPYVPENATFRLTCTKFSYR